MTKSERKIDFPREVLLVEIERDCAACGTRNRIGLTKDEAREFLGFECERCEHWNDDILRERDVPEWWEELKITGLYGLRVPEYETRNDLSEFDDAEDLNKLLRRAVRETKEGFDEKTSADMKATTNNTSATDDERERQRLLEIIRRRKREENIF